MCLAVTVSAFLNLFMYELWICLMFALQQFGRKKKKFRGKPGSEGAKKEPAKKPPVKVEEEDEDDDEEEEEGDLSKYKLDVSRPTRRRMTAQTPRTAEKKTATP